MFISMDSTLCASLHVLDVVDCNMPCVCENASMSVYPHDCDDMLHDSLGVVKIPNIKLLKKKAKTFHENLRKFISENDDLIAKLNESNKLLEKYKKLAEHSLEKLEFECLNVDLDAKLIFSNKLIDDLKCENESLKMHAKCLIAKPIAKNEDVICCNHVVGPNFMPIVSSTSKGKSVYIPPHKRNQKVERKALKPKPSFRSHHKDLNGSKFVPTCHHYDVIGYIRPQCSMLKREQNHVVRSLPKKPSGPEHIICHHCGAFGHLRPHCSKFHALKTIKRKEKLELLGSCAKKTKPDWIENGKLLKHVINALTFLSMCISGSHSSNPRLNSHKTLIPKNRFFWMRKGSYG